MKGLLNGTGGEPPVFDKPSLEREAGSITDPVARLRFLRQDKVQTAVSAGPPWYARRIAWVGAALVLLIGLAGFRLAGSKAPVAAKPQVTQAASAAKPKSAVPDTLPAEKIWLVETRNGVETYSNGLRIETRHEIANVPRSYVVYDRAKGYAPLAEPWTKVVGIVFHTTESQLVEFDPSQNAKLRRHGEGTLGYIQQVQAYHYVVDRFGRAFRVIREQDAAFHAGPSIWADAKYAYLNLNHPFLGVSFETQSSKADELPNVTAGQVTTARLLVDMLRQKYQIAAENCVTHAQVSINPVSMLVGYHTDWSSNFPFEEIGLPDNYALPLPSQTLFGFGYDPVFLQATGSRMWKGLLAADDQLREEARKSKVSLAALRARLQQEYKRVAPARAQNHSATEEDKKESDHGAGDQGSVGSGCGDQPDCAGSPKG